MDRGKKLLALLLAAMLMLMPAGCGRKDKKTTEAEPASTAPETTAETAAPEPVTEAPAETTTEEIRIEFPEVEALDYGLPENWAWYNEGSSKPVDVFLICPTVDTRSLTNAFDLNDKLKARFVNALDMERGIYEDSAWLFAPYYRQMSINAYSLPEKYREQAKEIAYRDVADAFRWYLENESSDRGLILAGFSQGAELCLEILKEFYGDDNPDAAKLRANLVTVYAIGWYLTEEMTEEYPQIVPAVGEKDNGTVVCFDCEDGTLTGTIIIPEGVKTLSINPLNWMPDGMHVDKSYNQGAVMNGTGEPIPEFCGAYIGDRGELVVTDISPADYPPGLDILPSGSYHIYDYMFFFMNLKENIAARVAHWLTVCAWP